MIVRILTRAFVGGVYSLVRGARVRLDHKAKYSFCCAAVFSALLAISDVAIADPQALWRITHDECVPEFRSGTLTTPCIAVDLSKGEDDGVVILKDTVGVAQLLAIPTRRIAGIEDPVLLGKDIPNYFAAAWAAKKNAFKILGHELPREMIAIAINSQVSRTQDQLHLHIDCVDANVARALSDYKPVIDFNWQMMSVALKGRRYWIRRLDSDDLSDFNPFRLLADGVPGAAGNMGNHSLVVVGSTFSQVRGFILLADRAESKEGGHGEDLEDHRCEIANDANIPNSSEPLGAMTIR